MPISHRADELLVLDNVISWPAEPHPWVLAGNESDSRDVHDPRLEALRARMGKHMVYVACDPDSEGDGPPLKFAQYINQAIELRNDLSYAEESMALAHELGHVCLHPEQGNINDIDAAAFDQEERVLQVVGMLLTMKLELGDYDEFAAKWGFTHFAPRSLTEIENRLAARICQEMMQMIQSLKPRAADDYYKYLKDSAPVYVQAD